MSFHNGEIAVQTKVGVRSEAERLSGGIRNFINPAAEKFLPTQQLAIASSVDVEGRVWASLLLGEPGFVRVLNEKTAQVHPSFPINDLLYSNLQNNSQVGLLVIDLTNRRRLRLNGKAQVERKGIINLEIQQVFFNCPKYIQVRHLETSTTESPSQSQILTKTALSNSDRDWISQADTFFIASFNPESGADASHRGGNRGFVQLMNNNKLIFPDYAGNNMFQTFGNFVKNPNSGILFVDFERGHTLQLTGKSQVIWDANNLSEFSGAERLVEFDIQQVLEIRHATPWCWKFGEYSPVNP
ncbi:pyridoxamine 5'-phosphate oxidase family protein [Mastigocoleus testarum]|uniref:Pyridoxamine 5-phosphate oxidase n=1 Tax=Mastigocoleus testarum BC008 TaxID=371196 RepID=A0A0V7ZQ82_9CYAN|nr:pyridoxamine 5'-phosphate oxidase family protein [Mastigocoleus testarum]KST66805.1 pyridoxamine 5-phosphate oxidase [Mastigocoleus testarum BC008]